MVDEAPTPTALEEAIKVATALILRAESVEKTLIAHADAVDKSAATKANAAIIMCIAAFVIGVVVNVALYTSVQHDNVLKHDWLAEFARKNPSVKMPTEPAEWSQKDE